MKKSTVLAVVTFVFVLGLDFVFDKILPDSSIRQLIMFAACNIVVALSLNIINGMAGQFSIGHAGFVGLGAYTSAIVASHLHPMLGGGEPTFGRSFIVVPICLACSATFAGFAGLVVGLPSMRLRGDYLAIVTLAFAEIFKGTIASAKPAGSETIGQAWSAIGSQGFVHFWGVALSSIGGTNGYSGPDNAGVPLYAGPFWVLGIAAIMGVTAWRLKFSGWGRALRALRDDEIAAAAVGIDPVTYKVRSFVFAAMGAGIAGGLLALMRDGTPIVQPETYNFAASFDAITMVILGGSGSVTGAAIGGLFVTFTVKAIELVQGLSIFSSVKDWLDLNALRMIVYAAVLIALMILRPEGLLGERELFARKKKPQKKVTV